MTGRRYEDEDFGFLESESDAELVAEAFALGTTPVAPSAALKARLFESLERDERALARFGAFVDVFSRVTDLSRARVLDLLGEVERRAGWDKGYTAGFRFLHFAAGPRCSEAYPGLVWLEGSFRFPLHRHTGKETVLVLEGELYDLTSGVVAQAGGLIEMETNSVHAYRAGASGLLFLVVLEKGIEMLEPGEPFE
ncbi:MAG: hypothetical protein HYV07_30020 [Deltaproteobacteria bacterium]|nr:hypothetical protein [Deltaproteobacteria bacterium]